MSNPTKRAPPLQPPGAARTWTLPERLDHVAASGYQFEICAEAAAEIRRLETILRRRLRRCQK